MFSIIKLPEIQFFCQEVNLPDINLPAITQATPLSSPKHPGDKLEFGPLNVTFLIDEDLKNWKAIYNWMVALGFPRDRVQFSNYISANQTTLNNSITQITTSDAVLQILSSSNNPVSSIEFIDVFPTNLTQIQLQSTTNETTYLAGQATFEYTLYQFVE
jgi:hypothetical protein